MPFCKNCGRLNNSDAQFCGFCGASFNPNPELATVAYAPTLTGPTATAQSTTAMPPPPPPPPNYQQPPTYQPPPNYQQPAAPQMPMPAQNFSETVFGVILLRKPKSLGRYDPYTGIVTAQRMIFAQMTSDMLKQASQTAKEQAKADGKGFWGQMKDQFSAWYYYSQKYLNMEPSAALSETAGNFAVNNNTISEIKIKLKELDDENSSQRELEMKVDSAQGKYEFRLEEKDEYVNLLKQVYGERVKMPFGYLSSHGARVKLF